MGVRFTLGKVVLGRRPKLNDDVPEWLCNLIRRCWDDDKKSRPSSFAEILSTFEDTKQFFCSRSQSTVPKPRNSIQEEYDELRISSHHLKVFETKSGVALRETKRDKNYLEKKRKKGSIARMFIGFSESKYRSSMEGLWKRMVHLFAIFGISCLLSIIVLLVLIVWTSRGHFFTDSIMYNGTKVEGFATIDMNFYAGWGFAYPLWFSLAGACITNLLHIKIPCFGDKTGAIGFTIAFVIWTPPFQATMSSIAANPNILVRYSMVECAISFAYFIAVCISGLLIVYVIHVKVNKQPFPKWLIANDKTDEDGGANAICANVLTILSNTAVMFGYPFFILPQYFNASPLTRFLVVVILHPFLLECGEVIPRIAQTSAMKKFLKQNNGEQMAMQMLENSYLIKQIMGFYRRFMLLGSVRANSRLWQSYFRVSRRRFCVPFSSRLTCISIVYLLKGSLQRTK